VRRRAPSIHGWTLGVLALACSLGLAGCNSSSAPNPCSLLDQGGIKEATGVAVQKGQIDAELTNDTQSTCVWRPESGDFPSIQVYLSAGGEQVTTQRADADTGYGVASVDVTIAGARDAYAAGNGSLVGMVMGDYFVQVAYLTPGTADALDKTTALATKAAAAF
jgi:hypothetical protein